MSGVKDTYVNLRQSEYNRLMASCRRLDDVESRMQAGMKKLRKKLKEVERRQNQWIEKQERQFRDALQEARLGVAQVLASCDAQESCRFTFETEDGVEEAAGEVDFWTQGALTQLRQQAEAEMRRLDAPDDLTLYDLKQSTARSEAQYAETLQLAERAKEALLASQLRNNIGQTIGEALAEANWEITDAAYQGEDFRGAVHVKLANLQGDELLTIITPEEGQSGEIRNHINISFFDRSCNDETFRENRLKAITGMLQEDGLECGRPVCAKGTENRPCEDESRLDFERVRKARG